MSDIKIDWDYINKTVSEALYHKKEMIYDPLLGWHPKIEKTTEAEINKGWEREASMSYKGPYEEGELVEHSDGKKYRVKECHGENIDGVHEYYLEPCIPTHKAVYATEREIFRSKPSLPPLPTKETKSTKSVGCEHVNAYENIISSTMRFWVCPDCKKEIDDPNSKPNHMTQSEIDAMLEEFERMFNS